MPPPSFRIARLSLSTVRFRRTPQAEKQMSWCLASSRAIMNLCTGRAENMHRLVKACIPAAVCFANGVEFGDEGQSRGGKVGRCGLQHRNLGWCAELIPKFYLTLTVDPVMPTTLRAHFCLSQPLALLLLSLTQEQSPLWGVLSGDISPYFWLLSKTSSCNSTVQPGAAAPGPDKLFLKLPERREA